MSVNLKVIDSETRSVPEERLAAPGVEAQVVPLEAGEESYSNEGLNSRIWQRIPRWLTQIARLWLLAVLVGVWQYISTRSHSLSILLPPPTAVAAGAIDLVRNGLLLSDTLVSLKRVGVALGMAVLIGVPLGTALGASRRLSWSFEPVVNFFRPIPPLAWIPLSILWFGISDAQNEFIIFLAAFFPILLNTTEGVRDVDRRLIRAARTLGANPATVGLTVVLPAALPQMFVGLRIGIGIAWMALVAGELVSATSGLGYLINQGRYLFRSDYVIVGMVAIGVIGLLLDGLAQLLQFLVTPWRR